ncbi:MAG: SIR2 family protein [Chloroflexota bacterium]
MPISTQRALPHGIIAQLFRRGEVVPFLGAGVNMGCRPPGARWEPGRSDFLPSGFELSRYLANEAAYPYAEERELADLAKVASYFVESSDRSILREQLRTVFNRDYQPGAIHTLLAEVAAVHPLLIVTTNYDDLTERAFKAAGQPYDLVVYPTDQPDWEAGLLLWRHGEDEPERVLANNVPVDLATTNVIYKMHGTVNRQDPRYDSYVITEDDYVEFLTRMINETAVPAQFLHHFRRRSFLFLGYGLGDWNLRVVLKHLREVDLGAALGGAARGPGVVDGGELRRSWAVQFQPTALDEFLWDRRRVIIFDADINAVAEKLRETLTAP